MFGEERAVKEASCRHQSAWCGGCQYIQHFPETAAASLELKRTPAPSPHRARSVPSLVFACVSSQGATRSATSIRPGFQRSSRKSLVRCGGVLRYNTHAMHDLQHCHHPFQTKELFNGLCRLLQSPRQLGLTMASESFRWCWKEAPLLPWREPPTSPTPHPHQPSHAATFLSSFCFMQTLAASALLPAACSPACLPTSHAWGL